MKPWTWTWFVNLITWCRKWSWFDTYIYGKSKDMEDFVRNPAEVLRDTVPLFVFKDFKAYSLFCIRIGFTPFTESLQPVYKIENPAKEDRTYWNVTCPLPQIKMLPKV